MLGRRGSGLTLPKVSAARVVVVGAGAFGGWTALELARRGTMVTLIDAWGPRSRMCCISERRQGIAGSIWGQCRCG
ncbi:MAG: FAD-dependent oxidoreductase [Gemmatimonadaceae bacterium]